MKAFYFVAVIAAVAVADVSARARALDGKRVSSAVYDCSGQRDGNRQHPTNCNKYIACSGGLTYEMDCAICTYDPVRCPNERTVYNASVDKCLWADETTCGSGGAQPTSLPPVEETEAPENPPTQPPVEETEAPENPPTQPPVEETEAPENPTTQPPVEETEAPENPTTESNRPPQEGDACNPEFCKNSGYCQHYLRCDKDTGKLVKEECGKELVWNPLNENGTEHIHGGNCDTWENLSDEIENKYRTDEECLACFWRETGECQNTYLYQEPNLRHRTVLELTCAEGLVFSKDKETCQLCSDVTFKNGTSCCNSGGSTAAP